jgi:diguanylate cyclase (GGDEF)-like protein
MVQLDTNFFNINFAHFQNIINLNKSTQFTIKEEHGIYTISKYMPELGLYLVVRRNAENTKSDFSNLILYMTVGFSVVLGMFLIFVKLALRIDREKIEENAKKHGLASYADLYISTHLIDMKNNSLQEITCNPKYKLIFMNDTETAAKQLENSIREICALESLKTMLHFVDFATLHERLKENRVINCEFRTREYGWCKAYFIVNEYDKNHEISQIVFAIELIDEEKKRENELIYLSQTDLMTGLRNRGSGEKAMQDLMAAGVEGMFCLMDADKFKSINDNYGHDVGDKVIKAIAECLKRTFRNTDITMRLGGDEFAVYVVGVVNETYGEVFIENFFDEIDAIEIPELRNRKITISLGAAFFTVDENFSFAEVYKHADSAAYESKKFTGSHHTFYKK